MKGIDNAELGGVIEDAIQAYVAQAVADEREACAQTALEYPAGGTLTVQIIAASIARAIRART